MREIVAAETRDEEVAALYVVPAYRNSRWPVFGVRDKKSAAPDFYGGGLPSDMRMANLRPASGHTTIQRAVDERQDDPRQVSMKLSGGLLRFKVKNAPVDRPGIASASANDRCRSIRTRDVSQPECVNRSS